MSVTRKNFWALAALLAIELSIIMLLVPGGWTKSVINKEATLIERSLGQTSVTSIYNNASKWYTKMLLDSGALEGMRRWVIPTQEQMDDSRGIERMGVPFFKWWENRIDAFSALSYQVLARFALLLLWLPYIAILIIPAAYDGWQTWQIKRTNFDYASPVIHRYSSRGMSLLVFGLLVIFFLPIAIDPIIVPVVMMLSVIFMGLMIGNLQKRI